MGVKTRFDIWWNKPSVKRWYGVLYSIGAAVVIVGALFKILHLPFASEVLTVGMLTEAMLFAFSAFDKPHKEYDWDNVFDFEGNPIALEKSNFSAPVQQNRSLNLNYNESISDDDVRKLTEGIKKLSNTAEQLASLNTIVSSTDNLVKNINSASDATSKFVYSQDALSQASSKLQTSYQSISNGMEVAQNNTKAYAAKIDEMNKSLSSINSIYEIQLKNIQSQTESLFKQTQKVNAMNEQMDTITNEVEKMKSTTSIAAQNSDIYKSGTEKLAKQINELNSVYGNMLNALN
jgi:gliding motility-associated protein GldL